jgi:hypothetical protein
MGILHRLFARHAPDVWQAEARLLHRLGFVQPPQAVQWISTSACDLTCPHCYSHAGKRAAGELTTDEAKRLLIDELVKVVALAILWRWWRGRNIVLRGRWSPRFVRMVAVVLVVLGVGVEKTAAAPVPRGTDKQSKTKVEEDLPATVTALIVGQWLMVQHQSGAWGKFKAEFAKVNLAPGRPDDSSLRAVRTLAAGLPPRFGAVVAADLDALAAGRPSRSPLPGTGQTRGPEAVRRSGRPPRRRGRSCRR